jgi:hypothetical protein
MDSWVSVRSVARAEVVAVAAVGLVLVEVQDQRRHQRHQVVVVVDRSVQVVHV